MTPRDLYKLIPRELSCSNILSSLAISLLLARYNAQWQWVKRYSYNARKYRQLAILNLLAKMLVNIVNLYEGTLPAIIGSIIADFS